VKANRKQYNLCICRSIDASESERLARYVNDSPRQFANCIAKPTLVDGRPHVVLSALKNIEAGTELRYDYGRGNLPWRKVGISIYFLSNLSPS
jgi:hypothetical protein